MMFLFTPDKASLSKHSVHLLLNVFEKHGKLC